MADLVIPQAVRDHDQVQKSRGAEGEPEGFVYRGKVYIVAGELATPTDVIRVLFHESLGHVGLRGVFGDKLKPILDQLAALRRGDIIKKARQYGLVRADANGNPVVDVETATDKEVFAAMDQGHKREAAEEVLAVMAQTKPEMGYVKRAIALIRGWLRANVPGFGAMKMTDADIIANYILPARRFIEGKGGPGSGNITTQSVLSRGKSDQTDTPAFKKWFGDWMAQADAKTLLDGGPVSTLQGDEVSSITGTDEASIKQMREDARAWGKDNITGQHTNTRSNITIEIRPRGVKEAVSHGSGPDKLRAMAAIPALIRDGVVVFDGKNPKNSEQRLVAIAAKVRIKGADFVVTAGMREDSNGRLFYDHELMEIESAGRLSSEPGLAQGKNTAPPAHLNDMTRRFITQASAGGDISKVVDKNGKPLVVYHATDSDITVFDLSMLGSVTDNNTGGDQTEPRLLLPFSAGYCAA